MKQDHQQVKLGCLDLNADVEVNVQDNAEVSDTKVQAGEVVAARADCVGVSIVVCHYPPPVGVVCDKPPSAVREVQLDRTGGRAIGDVIGDWSSCGQYLRWSVSLRDPRRRMLGLPTRPCLGVSTISTYPIVLIKVMLQFKFFIAPETYGVIGHNDKKGVFSNETQFQVKSSGFCKFEMRKPYHLCCFFSSDFIKVAVGEPYYSCCYFIDNLRPVILRTASCAKNYETSAASCAKNYETSLGHENILAFENVLKRFRYYMNCQNFLKLFIDKQGKSLFGKASSFQEIDDL